MKCQNCGRELPGEHLYCEYCGCEFQIVPDFEPEIENSIAETLSAVGETVEEEALLSLKDSGSKINNAARKFSKGKMLGILAVLFLAVSFGVYLYLYSADGLSAAFVTTYPKADAESVTEESLAAENTDTDETEPKEEVPTEAVTESPIDETPSKPEVFPASGTYKNAQFIELIIPEGCQVYYTTDLNKPTPENGNLYEQPIPIPLGESRFSFIAFDEEGRASECVHRNFMLNMKTGITLEDAETLLVQKLISTGHLLDKNGALTDRYGVFRYFYKYPMAFGEKNFYIFEEHYMENLINDPQGNFYAIEVVDGEVYRLDKDANGQFVRVDF